MYLCTEGKILAHADVDMSLLLLREEWQGRSTWEFGRTGLEGDFQLRLPGEPISEKGKATGAARQRGSTPIVTIGAELFRAGDDSNPSDLSLSGLSAGAGGPPGEAASKPEEAAGASKVSTWSYLAPRRQRGIITAAIQRLELKPTPSRGGSGAALSDRDRVDGVLVGITGVAAAAELVPGAMGPGAAAASAAVGDSFRMVGCGERGEIDTEDSELLETITWRWEGEFPDLAKADADGDEVPRFGGSERKGQGESSGARGHLASIKVLVSSGGAHSGDDGDVEIATGLVPWPSSTCSGRQYVNVTLLSPEGSQLGSCRVCLLLSFAGPAAATATGDNTPTATATGTRTRTGVGGVEEGDGDDGDDDTSFEPSFEQESEYEGKQQSAAIEGEGAEQEKGGPRSAGRGGRDRDRDRVRFGVRSTGVQAEEPPLEGNRDAAGGGARGTAPRSYRMSINLASVKDLENAAYVVCRRRDCLWSFVYESFVLVTGKGRDVELAHQACRKFEAFDDCCGVHCRSHLNAIDCRVVGEGQVAVSCGWRYGCRPGESVELLYSKNPFAFEKTDESIGVLFVCCLAMSGLVWPSFVLFLFPPVDVG